MFAVRRAASHSVGLGKLLKRVLLVKTPSTLRIPAFGGGPVVRVIRHCPMTHARAAILAKSRERAPGNHGRRGGRSRVPPRTRAAPFRARRSLLAHVASWCARGPGREEAGAIATPAYVARHAGFPPHPLGGLRANGARAAQTWCRAGPPAKSRVPGSGSPSWARDRRRSQRRHSLLGTGRFCGAARRRSCSRSPPRKAYTTPRGSPRASATATWTWRGQAPPFAALSFSRSCRIASA
jgi:hypothetical protein